MAGGGGGGGLAKFKGSRENILLHAFSFLSAHEKSVHVSNGFISF